MANEISKISNNIAKLEKIQVNENLPASVKRTVDLYYKDIIRFKQYSDNKADKQWKELIKVVYKIAFSCGVSDPPTQDAATMYAGFIVRQYPDFNAIEVMEAFDLYCAQKLDFKADHFGVFDNVFIGKVLTSYKSYRSKCVAQAVNSQKTIEAATYVSTPDDIFEYLNDFLIIPFKGYLKSETYPWTEIDEKQIYFSLETNKIVLLTAEEKKSIANDVTAELNKHVKKYIKSKRLFKKPSGEIGIDPENFKWMCRAWAFKYWINEQKFNETDLEKLIRQKLNLQ